MQERVRSSERRQGRVRPLRCGWIGLCVAIVATALALPGNAQDRLSIADVDISGEWRGQALFILPDGLTEQTHLFTLQHLGDGFYDGAHTWAIPAQNLQSHDGVEWTFAAEEPFLGVVDLDGDLWLVEEVDVTVFHLRLVDEDTLVFFAMEGGSHAVVGRGLLTRE